MLEETKLIQLKKELMEFATLIESMVDKSIPFNAMGFESDIC